MSVYMLREASQPAPPNNIRGGVKLKLKGARGWRKVFSWLGDTKTTHILCAMGGGFSTALILWKATETGMKLKQNDWKTLSFGTAS